MAIFVWVGNNQVMGGSATDLSGLTAAGTGPTLGDENYVTTSNRWNVTNNWRERIPAGQTGNTGGGGSGPAGSGYYYATATRWPGASGVNDVALFQYLYGDDGSRGLSAYHHYPKSELLYGGVSGANNLWNDSVLSSTADVMIQVESSYFDHGVTTNSTEFSAYSYQTFWTQADHMPYKRRRIGSDFRGRPVSGITQDGNIGLNLTTSTIEIDSSFSDMTYSWRTVPAPVMGAESVPCVETQVVLTGPDTVAKTKFEMYGQGDYKLYAQYMNRFIAYPVGGDTLNGNAGSDSGVPNYDRMPKIELNTNVTSLCRIAGLHLGRFDYNGLYGSTLGVNRMELGNKWVHTDRFYYHRGSYNLRAGVDDLRVYPSNIVDENGVWSRAENHYGVNPTSSYIPKRALVNIESYGVGTRTGLTMDKIAMFNSNPFQGVTLETPWQGSSAGWNNSVEYNCFHGESAATSTELLYNINMEGGIFWTRNIDGNLKITNGELNGHLATMNMSAPVGQDGSIEMSGMATGGYTGPGVFIIDPTARLIPPAGVRAAFRTPTGGSGDAELGSKGQIVPSFVRKQP